MKLICIISALFMLLSSGCSYTSTSFSMVNSPNSNQLIVGDGAKILPSFKEDIPKRQENNSASFSQSQQVSTTIENPIQSSSDKGFSSFSIAIIVLIILGVISIFGKH